MDSLWGYEARHCGRTALALPPLVGITAGVAISLLEASWHQLVAGEVFPVLAALPAAGIVAGEPARELQATVPHPYPRTVGRRLAVAGGALTTGAVLAAVVTVLLGSGADAATVLGLAWSSSALLVGAGALAGLLVGTPAGASAVVVTVWLGQLLVLERVLGDGAERILLPAVAGLALVIVTLHRLSTSPGVAVTGRAEVSA